MERIITPVSPDQFDYENEDGRSDFRCVGKSMTFQSKSCLSTSSIKAWLRSPNLNNKRKHVSPRPTEPAQLEASNEGQQNASKSSDTQHKKQVENTIFPAIVVNESAKRTSSMCDCKRPKKKAGKRRAERDESQIKHKRELPDIITERRTTRAFIFSYLDKL